MKKLFWVGMAVLFLVAALGCGNVPTQPDTAATVTAFYATMTGQAESDEPIPTLVVTQAGVTAGVDATVTPVPQPTPTPPPTVTVSGWADGVRVSEQNVYSRPTTASDIPFTFGAGNLLWVYGKAEEKGNSVWLCVSSYTQEAFGWMDTDQVEDEPALQDLEVIFENDCNSSLISPTQ